MTRKDFQLVADVIKSHAKNAEDSSVINAIALDFSVRFQKVNPRFDTKRFLDACGLERVTLGNGEEVHIVNGR